MSKHPIEINSRLSIPESELMFTASRSSGPGGQNVNKLNTRVTLWFDVAHSPSLTEDERVLILSHLQGRVNKEGVLWLISQESRSQVANREAAIARFIALLRDALHPVSERKKTRISRGEKLRRLADKRRRSGLKEKRSKRVSLED